MADDQDVIAQIGAIVGLMDEAADPQTYAKMTGALANIVRMLRYGRGEFGAIEANNDPHSDVNQIVDDVRRHGKEVLVKLSRSGSDPDTISTLAKAGKDIGSSLAWLRGEVHLNHDEAIAYLRMTLG